MFQAPDPGLDWFGFVARHPDQSIPVVFSPELDECRRPDVVCERRAIPPVPAVAEFDAAIEVPLSWYRFTTRCMAALLSVAFFPLRVAPCWFQQ